MVAGDPKSLGALSPFEVKLVLVRLVVLRRPRAKGDDLRAALRTSVRQRQLSLDVGAAPAEGPQHARRDPFEIGGTLAQRAPLNPEATRQFRAQLSLIQIPSRSGLTPEVRTRERAPASVGSAGDVPDKNVRVQLGVTRAARAVPKCRPQKPLGHLVPGTAMAASNPTHRALEVAERSAYGGSVGRAHVMRDICTAEHEEQSDGLGRRPAQIEREDIATRLAQGHAGLRVQSPEEGSEPVLIQRTFEAQSLTADADPLAGWSPALRV